MAGKTKAGAFAPVKPPDCPATKRAVAEYINTNYWPCAPRTVATFGLASRLLAGQCIYDWPDVVAFVEKRLAEAPKVASRAAPRGAYVAHHRNRRAAQVEPAAA